LKWYELGPFTVFDVETTGMNAVFDRIVELAAIRIDKDGSEREFHSLVNPGRTIPRQVICVHHITNEMVADAPDFQLVGKLFSDFAAGSALVAHNARFDLSFFQESLNRSQLPLWEGKTIDTLRLMRRTFPGLMSYKLQDLKLMFHLTETESMQAHRAGSDVRWTVDLLRIALEKALKEC